MAAGHNHCGTTRATAREEDEASRGCYSGGPDDTRNRRTSLYKGYKVKLDKEENQIVLLKKTGWGSHLQQEERFH